MGLVDLKQFWFSRIILTMMPVADDQVYLEQVVKLNQIDTRWFLPFLIYRLKEHTNQQVIQFAVTLQRIRQAPIEKRVLELRWRQESVP